MDIKYQIFISSTYEDLKEERKVIVESILKHYHFPIGMEMFSAEDKEQWEVIQNTIDTSDVYVLLLGHRYGSLTAEKISYTEKEFNYALERKNQGKIKILCFLREEGVALTRSQMEGNKASEQKLKKFRTRVKSSKIVVDFWDYKEALAKIFSPALSNTIKALNDHPEKHTGWVKVDSIAHKLADGERLENVRRLMVESSKNHDVLIEDVEQYDFDEVGSCVITRTRNQKCNSDVGHNFTQYITDKDCPDSHVIDAVELGTGIHFEHLVRPVNEKNCFAYFTIFDRQIKAGQMIRFCCRVFVQNYLSDLVDKGKGTISYEPFPHTKFKSKQDIFTFKNVGKLKNLKVKLIIREGLKTTTREIKEEIISKRRVYKIKYPAKCWNDKATVEFSIAN